VYGHSFGGHVGLALAAGWPDLIRALILGDTPLSLKTLAPHIEQNRAMTSAWLELAASRASSAEIARRLREIPEIVSVVEIASPWFESMATSLGQHDPDFLDSVLERLDESHRLLKGAAVLKRIRCPVLLIRADPARGGVVAESNLGLAAEFLSDCEVVNLVGVGHGLEDHVRLASTINRFLAGLVDA